jgi:hypothetical protein
MELGTKNRDTWTSTENGVAGTTLAERMRRFEIAKRMADAALAGAADHGEREEIYALLGKVFSWHDVRSIRVANGDAPMIRNASTEK